jgi:hypothetical protein
MGVKRHPGLPVATDRNFDFSTIEMIMPPRERHIKEKINSRHK